ncbi:hypothetical protein GCM10009775_04850 [Microbacterium aoyamense]|uniref:SRPBCC family protein n=1 Tax=Microbacterium aoyamense TaxID=344166 RepID=A0ABN2P8S3_9MICO|nr:hypothetical protein [Microbacterium aoyamense]
MLEVWAGWVWPIMVFLAGAGVGAFASFWYSVVARIGRITVLGSSGTLEEYEVALKLEPAWLGFPSWRINVAREPALQCSAWIEGRGGAMLQYLPWFTSMGEPIEGTVDFGPVSEWRVRIDASTMGGKERLKGRVGRRPKRRDRRDMTIVIDMRYGRRSRLRYLTRITPWGWELRFQKRWTRRAWSKSWSYVDRVVIWHQHRALARAARKAGR